MIALATSVAAHAVLLAIRFVAPDALRFEPADPGLEVILVNAKHAKAPTKAEALAQANLEGGGMPDFGHVWQRDFGAIVTNRTELCRA